mmetsp:Transcript_104742/g.262433  ORF Transcript_104742/g.262433 Transcript_104742/m.262433 type:complete len:627 (+) Transcript_104742:48-1928(+)|eukprot:CAMPEP_0115218986 /NCGR_PEP_ID=MMETSP0270-20121206/26679_1 /TAXON_ID=71861 /ORGANISM="Scrippsiella trochoidea, Strain CCMP3099" /LENGTH=626 /DNA_ID=CAMNT_0002632957 /DNA_START=48 /DNA_END=1928 /DNA_ORIENTATION=+
MERQDQQRPLVMLPMEQAEAVCLLETSKHELDAEVEPSARHSRATKPHCVKALLAAGVLLAVSVAVGHHAGAFRFRSRSTLSTKFLGANLITEPLQIKPEVDHLMRHDGGFCLDVPNLKSGVSVHMWTCATDLLEHESWHYDTNTWQIRNRQNMCLDAGGDHAHIWHCDSENFAQRWRFVQEAIVNEQTGFCLSKLGDEAVNMQHCKERTAEQRWMLSITTGQIKHAEFGCLHVPQPGAAGSLIGVKNCARPELQSWTYIEKSHQIRVGQNLCLEAPAPDVAGSGVRVGSCTANTASQGWQYYSSGQVVTKSGGLCLDTAHPKVVGGEVHLWQCDSKNRHQRWHISNAQGTKGNAPEAPRQTEGTGDMQEFYVYRAAADGKWGQYPFGNINVANMDGVIWYLMNEVVTNYGNGTRCPRKFGIDMIHRLKIRTKATAALIKEKMNFGARFAYDMGMCMGRCFPANKCTCKRDCDDHYRKYGFVTGCNNFYDKYPFPDYAPQAPGGIWYSLPLEGRCDYPTGEHDCTWSYEDAGVISLHELEAVSPGNTNCCGGHCTNFWQDLYSKEKTTWRSNKALDVFKAKYPQMPRDLASSWCDFDWRKWYAPDAYPKQDPWNSENGKVCRTGSN